MYQTVGNHSLEDFAPATLAMQHEGYGVHGIMAVVLELKQKLSEQLSRLGIPCSTLVLLIASLLINP